MKIVVFEYYQNVSSAYEDKLVIFSYPLWLGVRAWGPVDINISAWHPAVGVLRLSKELNVILGRRPSLIIDNGIVSSSRVFR